jgi:trigger factor
LEVTVDQSGTCEATVAVTVPWSEFQLHVERALRQQGRNVRMKGFRAGKVPMAVLEKQFGEQARGETVEHFLGQAFRKAVAENDLKPVGQHQIVVDKVHLEQGQHLEASFQVSLRPEIELAEYKGLEVESQLEPVLDQELESALGDLRNQRSRPEPVGDEGLPADGMVLCKVRFEREGEVLLEREGLRFTPQVPPPGVDPAEFERLLTGTKAGDAVQLQIQLPADFEREELRGQAAVCHLEVSEAYRIIPPTDLELQELLQVETWDELLDLAREKIGEAKRQREENRIESELLERLMAAHTFDLPERMVARQLESRAQQLRTQLTEQGLDEAQIEQDVEAQRPEMVKQTEIGIRAFFLVHALAEKEGVKVTQEDMVGELHRIAARNQATFEEVRDYYTKNNLVEQVGLELLERKVRRMLREHAQITQPS